MKVSLIETNEFDLNHHDFPDTDPSIPRSLYQYDTVRSNYENQTQQPTYMSVELNATSVIPSLTPPFQKRLSIVPVLILGILEIASGLMVLVLEILIFDIAIGLWCGFIYILAGVAAIVLG